MLVRDSKMQYSMFVVLFQFVVRSWMTELDYVDRKKTTIERPWHEPRR